MKKKSKVFDSIMSGLNDALAYAKGDKTRGKVHRVPIKGTKKSRAHMRNKHDKRR